MRGRGPPRQYLLPIAGQSIDGRTQHRCQNAVQERRSGVARWIGGVAVLATTPPAKLGEKAGDGPQDDSRCGGVSGNAVRVWHGCLVEALPDFYPCPPKAALNRRPTGGIR